MPDMGIQYDEQGRPYTFVGGTTRRSYISPVAMGTGSAPEDRGGILRRPWQWNQNKAKWEQPFDYGNLMTMGTAAALTGGAASAFMGGGAAAGGGAGAAGLSEAGIPTAVGLPAGAAGLPGAAGVGGAATAGAGSAGVGAASTGSRILGGLSNASRILTNAAGSQAAGQRADAAQQVGRDALNQQAYQLNTTLPGQRLSTGVRASRVSNASPVVFDRATGKFTGGYANPNLISPEARQLADSVLQSMIREQNGPGAPGATPAPRTSTGDKILGGAALGSSLVTAINPFKWF